MITYTPEQFKAKYGEIGLQQITSSTPPQKSSRFAIPSLNELGTAYKDIGTGFVKGVGSTGLAIAKAGEMISGKPISNAIQAGLDPNRTYSQVRDSSGINALVGKDIEEKLKSKNSGEVVGKSLEFLTEMLYGAGEAKILSAGAKKVGATFEGIGSKLSGMGDDVLEDGVKIKDKIGDLLVNLDQKTKTALDRTPVDKFKEVVEQGKKAISDDRITTPLEKVGENIIEAINQVKAKASQIGSKKSEYLKYPDAFSGDGVKKFKEGVQSFLNSRTMVENDKPIVKKIVEEFKKLGNTPSKGQVDKFIDYAQEALYSGEKNLVQPISNKTVSPLRSLISKLNDNLKNQLPEGYRIANKEYGELVKLSSEINTKLGKEGEKAGSFVKRLFSPSDARTKELFSELEKLTGMDFTRDARLAKFVMEALGDVRTSSILEQIPTSSKGFIDKAVGFAVDKLSDPLKAGERYLKSKGN